MRKLLIIGGLILLTSCAQYDATKAAGTAIKAKVNDEELKIGLQLVCDAASVGAVRRFYNGDFNQWSKACPQYFTERGLLPVAK